MFHYSSHVTNEKTEAQEGKMTYPRTHKRASVLLPWLPFRVGAVHWMLCFPAWNLYALLTLLPFLSWVDRTLLQHFAPLPQDLLLLQVSAEMPFPPKIGFPRCRLNVIPECSYTACIPPWEHVSSCVKIVYLHACFCSETAVLWGQKPYYLMYI